MVVALALCDDEKDFVPSLKIEIDSVKKEKGCFLFSSLGKTQKSRKEQKRQ